MPIDFNQKTPGRYSMKTTNYEFVFQWMAFWWQYPIRTWVQIDKGNFSISFRLFWLELIIFW